MAEFLMYNAYHYANMFYLTTIDSNIDIQIYIKGSCYNKNKINLNNLTSAQ